MSSESESAPAKKSFLLGRLLPLFAALGVAGALIYWFAAPKKDIRYARAATAIYSEAQNEADVLKPVQRNEEIEVLLSKELNGWATVVVAPSRVGWVKLADIDTDRRPVLTGAYMAKALKAPIKLLDEPNPAASQVDEIPARTMIQIWGYTETSSGKWAEITRFKAKDVGYVRFDELTAASD